MTIWRPMRYICVAIPEELLIEIEEAAKDYWYNRSECIRRLLDYALDMREPRKSREAVKEFGRINPLSPRLYDLDDS